MIMNSLMKAMYVCMLLSSFFINENYAKAKQPKTIPGTAIFVMANQEAPVFQTIKLSVKEPNIKLEMSIPQFTTLNDKNFQEKINKSLLKEAKQRKKEFLQATHSYMKEITKDNLSSIQFEYMELITPIKSKAPYIVIEQFRYQYSGGAHGLGTYDYLVIDTHTNKKIALSDLFKSTVDYKAIINKEIIRMIEDREKQGAFFFKGSDGFQSIKTNQPFFINENGEIVIVFNVYEIAPYAAGPQYFIIPKMALTPYLK